MSNHRIIITGATGWLGMAVIDLLYNALGEASHRRIACFGSSHKMLTLRSGAQFVQQPLTLIDTLDNQPSLLLHFAFLTKDKVSEMAEAKYRDVNLAISGTVLRAADSIGVDAAFLASSGAAYAADDKNAASDLRLYGAMKRADEERFINWATANNKTTIITRIFNVTGPYINKHQSYAFASFLLDALAGRPIYVKAPHRVIRANIAIRELMSLVFAMLLADSGEIISFDSGGEPLELGDIATAIARTIGTGDVNRAAISDPRVDFYAGNTENYSALLARYLIDPISLTDQITETAEFLVATEK